MEQLQAIETRARKLKCLMKQSDQYLSDWLTRVQESRRAGEEVSDETRQGERKIKPGNRIVY
jgi:hypothetical protein